MAHLVRLFLLKCKAQELLKAQSKDDNNNNEEEEEAEVKMEDSVVCGYLGLLVGLLVQPHNNNNNMDSDADDEEDEDEDEDRSSSSSVKKMKKLARWMLTKMPSGRFVEITRALRLFLAFQWHAAGGDLLPAANKDAEDGSNHHHPREPTSSSSSISRARRRPPPVLALYGKAALAATTRLVRALEKADANQCLNID